MNASCSEGSTVQYVASPTFFDAAAVSPTRESGVGSRESLQHEQLKKKRKRASKKKAKIKILVPKPNTAKNEALYTARSHEQAKLLAWLQGPAEGVTATREQEEQHHHFAATLTRTTPTTRLSLLISTLQPDTTAYQLPF